jgi:molybdopterin molybdotransferase
VIPFWEAQQFVIGQCLPLEPRPLRLHDALDCVVSEDVLATEPIPPFTNSSMDGYAVRAADTRGAPVRLAVVGSIMAGHTLNEELAPGTAARIMTGAPLPRGADAVCMIEETADHDEGRSVTIGREVRAGEFIRQPGRDVSIGDVVAPVGTVLTPAHLGVLANQGADSVLAHPRPHVGVLSTGDELYAGTGPLPPGKIRDANRQSLLALARREGWGCTDLGIVEDDEERLRQRLTSAASTCNAIITSGGVSVGDLDLVRVVLEDLGGGTMRWMQVAIRPAKPLAFGLLASSGTPVFGLPGNPVSAMVSFELFVRPALRAMGGHRSLHRPVVRAMADVDLDRRSDGKLHLLRARVTLDGRGGWHVRTTGGQESHQLHSMSEANALILLPDGSGARAGDLVDVMVLSVNDLSENGSALLARERQMTVS